MAKKKRKSKNPLSPNQQLWEKELKALKRRARYWEKKYEVLFTNIPERPKTVRKKDIEALKNLRWAKFTDEQKQEYRAEYNYREYRESQNNYDNYDNYDPYWWEPDYPATEEPVLTEAEMELWIEEKINSIVNPMIIDRERHGAKEELQTLLESAKNRMGTKEFYEYLQRPEVAGGLEKCAHEYLESYINKGTDYGWPSLNQFATILNMGRVLTLDEQEALFTERSLSFDYTDVFD